MVVSHGPVRFGTDLNLRERDLIKKGFPIAIAVAFVTAIVGLGLGVIHVRGAEPEEETPGKRPAEEDTD
jgi:hypothetical protein